VTQGLAGYRAEVSAAATNLRVPLHDGDFLALLAGLHRRTFAAGSGADHDHVVAGFIRAGQGMLLTLSRTG
jgi:hypothetical protein